VKDGRGGAGGVDSEVGERGRFWKSKFEGKEMRYEGFDRGI